jgi:hypothetical protein
MAKIQHLYSTVSGHKPTNLLRGQIAINIPDRLVYANDPAGRPQVLSSGNPGVSNPSGLLGVHVPILFHPVAQFGVTMTQADLQARFTDDGTTVKLETVPVFLFGTVWWTPELTCPSSPAGAYAIGFDMNARTVTLSAVSQGTARQRSGYINYTSMTAQLVVYSDSTIYPWFYLPQGFGNGPDTNLYRLSPVKTFAAIPVSEGFAGANATAYWGNV